MRAEKLHPFDLGTKMILRFVVVTFKPKIALLDHLALSYVVGAEVTTAKLIGQ